MIRSVILAATAAILVACGQDRENSQSDATGDPGTSDVVTPTPVRDVQYFLQNREEMDEKVAVCRNDPGQLALTPECINAFDARKEATTEGMMRMLETN